MIKKKSDGKSIVIPPESNDQLRRLMVLIGSKRAGNTNDMLAEVTGLLDALMKEKKIDIKMYKRFMKTFKFPKEVQKIIS